jgi:hypothetical protein
VKGHKRAARFGTSPIEGQISRIKAIKRQMYGRANYALLRRRVLLAALQPIQSRSLMLCRAIVLRALRMPASCSIRWNRHCTIGGRSIAAGSCIIATDAAKADSSGRRNIDFVTHGSHSSSASAGVFHPSVFLGRALRAAATAAIS